MKAKVLYIDDETPNLNSFKVIFRREYKIFVATSTKEAYKIMQEQEIQLVITDQKMPNETGIDFIYRVENEFSDVIFIVLTAYVDFEVAQKAIAKNCIYKYIVKPWKEDSLKLDIDNAVKKYYLQKENKNLLKNLKEQNTVLQKLNSELRILKNQLEDENVYLKEEVKISKNFGDIVTQDEKFIKILNTIEQVADSDAPVLIYGETGTGKELVARSIHNLSIRRNKAFISVNCAAIPESLFESELFGHEKGAFTGALNSKKGKFELANGGTLFLDEIGEIPIVLQSKLLRALQEGEIERVGSEKTIKLDIRIVSATNRVLQNDISDNKFRSDLFYRLSVFPINLPPLRERGQDISRLAYFFLEKFNKKYKKNIRVIPDKIMKDFFNYGWPGNIRELENILERAVIISNTNILKVNIATNGNETIENEIALETLADVERSHILKILNETSWKIGGKNSASEKLGLKRTTLISKMKKLGINK